MSNKLFNTNAERQKAYRRRKVESGKKADGRQRFNRLQEWREAHPEHRTKKNTERRFVAIDTEGITRGDNHLCCLLGDSRGEYIEDYRGGLSTHDAFEFLLRSGKGKTTLVGYSIGYDVNMILRDCSFFTLARLADNLKSTEKLANGKTYLMEWRPGKSFYVARLRNNAAGNREIEDSVLLYDVFGFFQKAFVKTAREFGVITKDDEEFLSRMKSDRSNFRSKDKEKIREYNFLECKVLVRIMDNLRDAMKIAECVPERWDGAGAIAAKLLKDNGMKERNETPEEMMPYFLGAYFGGRIQILQMGEHREIFSHDIISAYPSAMIELPSSIGTWKKTKTFRKNNPFALYVVEWKLPPSTIIAPFPFREESKGVRTINYPTQGKGVYWFPEVEAALKVFGDKIKIHYGYYFEPAETNVFEWIRAKFEARKRFKLSTSPREQLANVPLKLGLNSLYGKCAQGIGYKGMRPACQNYFWAGWITSKTRTRMFELAMMRPEEIIAFATDGVFSNVKLAESGSELGEWEVEAAEYLFILKAGLYAFSRSDDLKCYNETDNPKLCETLCDHLASKSRGHFLRDVPFTTLQKIWRRKGVNGKYSYKTVKFFGLKVSLAQSFDKWRRWIEVPRTINFFPSNQIPDDLEGKGTITRLRSYMMKGTSLPYTPKGDWYEGEEGQAYLDELDQLDSFYD